LEMGKKESSSSSSSSSAASSSSSSSSSKKRSGQSRAEDVISREYTINLHKRVHGVTFKKRAPRAVGEIRKFAKLQMGTPDIRIDSTLNKYVWSKGIRNVPTRVRVRLHRKRNEDEEATEKLYTQVSLVNVPSFQNLQTKVVKDEE